MWLVFGRGSAEVEGVGTLAEAAEVLVETLNGLCEVDGGVDGGGVDAADDAVEEEEERGADVDVDLAYMVVVEDRLSRGIGSLLADALAPADNKNLLNQNSVWD